MKNLFLLPGHASVQAAAEEVIRRWEGGNLAEAVRELSTALQELEDNQKEQDSSLFRKLRNQARKEFHRDGEIEVDDTAVVSRAEGNPDHGAYVQAWVWVDDGTGEE